MGLTSGALSRLQNDITSLSSAPDRYAIPLGLSVPEFQKAVSTALSIFDSGWLQGLSDSEHPVLQLIHADHAGLYRLGSDILRVQGRANFQNLIPRLLNNDQYRGARFEISVGARFEAAGRVVSFPSAKGSARRSDFTATGVVGDSIEVECSILETSGFMEVLREISQTTKRLLLKKLGSNDPKGDFGQEWDIQLGHLYTYLADIGDSLKHEVGHADGETAMKAFLDVALHEIVNAPTTQPAPNTWIGPDYKVVLKPVGRNSKSSSVHGPPVSWAIETRRLIKKIFAESKQLTRSQPGLIVLEVSDHIGRLDSDVALRILKAIGSSPAYDFLTGVVFIAEADTPKGNTVFGTTVRNEGSKYAKSLDVQACLQEIDKWFNVGWRDMSR